MKHDTTDTAEIAKSFLDALSVVTVVATLVEMLPSIAAIFTILWTGIRIWETDTVRKIFGRGLNNAVDE
jgi:hypothetical protein